MKVRCKYVVSACFPPLFAFPLSAHVLPSRVVSALRAGAARFCLCAALCPIGRTAPLLLGWDGRGKAVYLLATAAKTK